MLYTIQTLHLSVPRKILAGVLDFTPAGCHIKPKTQLWKDLKTSYEQMHSIRMHSVFCTFDLFFFMIPLALNSLYCADVPLSNYSLTHSLTLFLCICLLTRDLYVSTLVTPTYQTYVIL